MDHDTRDYSSRRSFLSTTALASIGWLPILPHPKSLGHAAATLLGARPAPLLDPEGEVRLGLIGLTGDRRCILDAIPNIPGARLVAFAHGQERAGEQAQGYPEFHKKTRLYATYQEMLANEELDVVVSCLPDGRNAHACMAAARKGCHVISEKPVAADLNTLADLEAAVRENQVQITAALHMRLNPGVAAVRKAIADGLIGEPVVAFAQKSYQSESDHSGQSFPSVGIDALDAITYTTGKEATQASALRIPTCAQEIPGILVKLANDSTGIVSLNCLPSGATGNLEDRLRVVGADGVVEMNGHRVELIAGNDPPRLLPLGPRGSILGSSVASLRGQGSHLMAAEEVFRVARVHLVVRQAAEQGKALRIA